MIDRTSRIWGKFQRQGSEVLVHPLDDHCLDVAAVFREILSCGRPLQSLQATTTTRLDPQVIERLACIAFLHDVGKCNTGFQAKIDIGATETAGHVLEAIALLCDDSVKARWPDEWASLLREMCDWFDQGEQALLQMLIAAISHHGRPVSYNEFDLKPIGSFRRCWMPRAQRDPMQALGALSSTVRRSFPDAFSSSGHTISASPAFQQRFAGLVMLADWIGSDTQFFSYRSSHEEDRQVIATAAASKALRSIGLHTPLRRSPASFEETFQLRSPNKLQQQVIGSAFDPRLAQLILIESETGSGKTEAALAWFLRLYAEGLVDGLYFALPTRVAARELYGRVCQAIARGFPDADDRPEPVLLAVPGYARIHEAPRSLPDPAALLWNDDAAATQRERHWASEHPKRFLAAPVAVGTIDQALLSAVQVRHSLLRSVCLDRHLLVVDEVHASDVYMSGILRNLIDGHRSRGGYAALLSATLGEVARASYFGCEMLPLERASQLPYPAVTTPRGMNAVPSSGRNKSVRVQIHQQPEDESLIEPLCSALESGARVLVVCNTVSRVNRLLRLLEGAERFNSNWIFQVRGVRCPHHGRFAREHRELLDEAVSARLGKRSPPGPVLLAGTQTLEQSLDIDADWLITDLCPMDVLIQRMGRLHRHPERDRPPGFDVPRVLLRVPEELDLSRYLRAGRFRGPPGMGLGAVYADGRILQRTLQLLRQRPDVELPRDSRRLVEEATHPEALALLSDPAWLHFGSEVIGQEMQWQLQAATATLENLPFGDLHYPGAEERIRVRLGDGSMAFQLAPPTSQPFGTDAQSITIPAHLLPSLDSWPDSVSPLATTDGFRFSIGSFAYEYTRFGLEKVSNA